MDYLGSLRGGRYRCCRLYRVLDLTHRRDQLAGMMLADAGAEVILVEPQEGSRSRRVGPFVDGREGDPESSLRFWAYNRGKKSITLDLTTEEGHRELKELAERSRHL